MNLPGLRKKEDDFDIPLVSFDDGELSGLSGNILYKIYKIVPINNHNLYRVDDPMIAPDNRRKMAI